MLDQDEIISFSGNLCLIRLASGTALRVPMHRLYKSEKDAQNDAHKAKRAHRSPYDYM